MNKDFPRIITFLRKERGLSQKQVAGDMGISQALLSHYEKGIRECGLDFLVKTAEYYGVSTDYLLGRTVQRNFTADPFEAAEKEVVINTEKGSMINKINRSLLMNTTSVIYDLLAKIGNKHLTNAVSNYLMTLNSSTNLLKMISLPSPSLPMLFRYVLKKTPRHYST